jgi:hypothetical protein
MTRVLLLSGLLCATGCEQMPWHEEDPPDPGCEERQAFHPDADGDGAGDDATLYVGCEAPAGWIAAGGDCDDTDASTTACPETGDPPADTGDSAAG